MFRNVLIAAAIVIASPALAGAQDIFWSFSPTELVTELYFASGDPCEDASAYDGPIGDTGSAYIFSDGLFGFHAIDLDFTLGHSNAISVTGGEVFNPTFNTIGGTRFYSSPSDPSLSFEIAPDGSNTGRLLAFSFGNNFGNNGVNPNLSAL